MQIVAFRACRVSDYRGKSLNASSDQGDVVVEPNTSRCRQLRTWIDERSVDQLKQDMVALSGDIGGAAAGGGKRDAIVSIGEMKHLAENDSEISNMSKAGYYNVDCHLSWIFIDETM